MADRRDHWEDVYRSKAETALSWYQPHSGRSLDYIAAAADKAAPIIDIGGGASTLVDDLLARGYSDVTVLDVAEAALAKSKARLGPQASRVSWISADITQWQPSRRYRVWHDRAVFHFLTEAKQRAAYVAALKAATLPGAAVIMSTFAPGGPEKCSGLPIQQYTPDALAAQLGPSFVLTAEDRETHRTPSGKELPFSYGIFRRQ